LDVEHLKQEVKQYWTTISLISATQTFVYF
jgi:hypothetical protein